MSLPKALVRAAVAAWASLVPLAGCSTLPEAAPIAAAPQPVEPAAEAVEAVEALPEVPAELPAVTTTRKVRVFGHITLPKAVGGLANARDGLVIGAPVVMRDVPSGRTLASSVTFYDGSFWLDVPADLGARPVLITVDLVDGASREHLFPLAAPLQLHPELAEQEIEVSPATTAWYALLYRMAARQTKAPPPDWTQLVPGVTTRALAGMIIGSKTTTIDSFSLMAASDQGLEQVTTASGLKQAIQGLVERLVATARPMDGSAKNQV